MASGEGYRSPMQSANDSFELRRDDNLQKPDPDAYRRSRPRGNSNAVRPSSIYHQAPPVDDAVNHAFERSDAASQVDPTLVAQITEQVINTLKASGIGQQQQQPPQPPPPHARSAQSRSPAESAASLPGRYTPPSPTRDNASHRSLSPEPAMFDSDPYNVNYDLPRPNRSSGDASPVHPQEANKPRPKQVRVPSVIEETVLEKAWQPLFQSGQPTARLSQFLRGLALHIIDDYEPKRSLVIPPAKMLQFFDDVKLPTEIYPWRDVFGGRITCESISKIYRDLRCQHHFVQLGNHSVPDIPALTPDGFDRFMTTLIQAHPALEYERLAKAVLDMPISNADNPKERFPKELSQRLFPTSDDITQQQRLHAAISADRNIQLRSSNPMPPPPPPSSAQPQSQSQPGPTSHPTSATYAERERAPYSGYASAIDEDDLRTTPAPIERQRQPYTAKEGSGKIHEEDRWNSDRSDHATRTTRANSAAPQPQFSQSRPTDIPSTSQRHHRLSASGQRPNLGTPPNLGYPSNPYTRSEGTNVGEIPSAYYSSNLHSDDRSRYPRREDESRDARDTKRASWYPSRGYDYDSTPYDDKRRTNGGTDGYGSYGGYPPRY
ncbi:unnamed protein product [Aureobasidium pullulans]|uniref:DUF7514 domain-containing protein n=1 Tax=Aureobasidium pullulans TaxID=5580 RepID=A0A4S9YNR5_AURPU|nr:hypothetical protein D6C94_07240 [Aureobasidium pullulans]THZ45750.1 hypothetical protein D6C87_02641 [Aureobasidium pullulans]THZ55017.1 hypothetical protein D6C86_08963 [Aureobasidium pullulans]THZ93144.1 hypothetical protein D6C88_02850 [Aureobasidium pullulans]CAD0018179.1 unnamed protein product [Aureobasidium pullulans]